jgi:hypothetical protein
MTPPTPDQKTAQSLTSRFTPGFSSTFKTRIYAEQSRYHAKGGAAVEGAIVSHQDTTAAQRVSPTLECPLCPPLTLKHQRQGCRGTSGHMTIRSAPKR